MESTLLSLLASIYLAAGIIFFGRKRKTYSHFRHTISELGESGSPYERAVSVGLFLPVGLALVFISFLNNPHEALRRLSFCIGAGYLVAAFFPCDKGSPLDGSWRQHAHNLGGFAEYGGGAYFISHSSFEGAFSFISTGLIAAIVVVCTLLLAVPTFSLRGLVQRVAEVLLFLTVTALTVFS